MVSPFIMLMNDTIKRIFLKFIQFNQYTKKNIFQSVIISWCCKGLFWNIHSFTVISYIIPHNI